MSNDLKTISELEHEIKHKLPNLKSYEGQKPGYETDTEQNVIGLNLHSLGINKIPQSLKKLKYLKHLHFIGNNLKDISPLIGFDHLETLLLQANKIEDITPITHLKQLTVLSITHNKIRDFSPILSLKSLNTLSVGNNPDINYNQLPLITSLRSFTLFTATWDYQETFDCTLLSKLNLEELIFFAVELINYNEINKLKKIKGLSIYEGGLKDIHFLQGLTELQGLYLVKNEIKDVSILKNMTQLKMLNLSRNQIKDIEPLLSLNLNFIWEENYSENNCMNIFENPIENPPIEIAKKSDDAIRNYFEQLKDEKDYLYEAKLLLVGEERAGKSTISEALRNPDFKIDLNKTSTHGMDISQWNITCDKTKTPKDFRFNIWDFGGQEIYHATHQFFLTKRSLYLFITEARKDVRYDDFYYWLNIINTLAGDSPVILIQNKTDQDHKNQSIDEYRNLFPQIFTDLQQISCNTEHPDWNSIYGAKLNILKENIYKVLKEKRLKGVGDELPKPWVDIRKEISKLQNQKINFITLAEYLNICNKYKLNRVQALFLSDYFHDLGVFLHFKDDIQLKDTIFINHEWVTKGIYNVFDSKKIKDAHGKFTNQDLMEIWDEPQFVNKQAELLNLMKNPQFKICYQHQDGYYLAPQLFNDRPLQYYWKTNIANLIFRYQYEFMPKGLLSQLIVMMHKYIHDNIFWLHGVLFQYKSTQAIVKEDRFGKKNLISIRVEGIEKKELLAIITSKIEEINNSYTNLKISEEFGCCCIECNVSESPYFYSAEVINRAVKKGKKSLECQISFEEVEINSLLGNYIPLERIALGLQNTDQYRIERILTNTESIKKGQIEIKSKLDSYYEYLIQLPANQSDINEIHAIIKKVNDEGSDAITEKIIDYITLAFEAFDGEMDEKLQKVYTDLKMTDDWETKVKLSIPLLNLVGVNVESTFKLNKYIKKLFTL